MKVVFRPLIQGGESNEKRLEHVRIGFGHRPDRTVHVLLDLFCRQANSLRKPRLKFKTKPLGKGEGLKWPNTRR